MNEQRQSVIVKHDTKDQPTTDLWRDESVVQVVHPEESYGRDDSYLSDVFFFSDAMSTSSTSPYRDSPTPSSFPVVNVIILEGYLIFIILNVIIKVLTVKRNVNIIVKIVWSGIVNIIFRCFIRFQHIWRAQLVGMGLLWYWTKHPRAGGWNLVWVDLPTSR